MTASHVPSDDRKAQIGELRSLLDDGMIDAAKYERRRSQILAPGVEAKSFPQGKARIPEPEPLTRLDFAWRFALSLGLVAALVYGAIRLRDAGLGWLVGLIVVLLLTAAVTQALYTVVTLVGTLSPSTANRLLNRIRESTDDA